MGEEMRRGGAAGLEPATFGTSGHHSPRSQALPTELSAPVVVRHKQYAPPKPLADNAKKAIAALALCTVLAACTTPKGSFCAISKPIRPSAETVNRLSDEEVKDILAANKRGQALCGWRP